MIVDVMSATRNQSNKLLSYQRGYDGIVHDQVNA